jgi:hypothetical protein
MQLTRLTPGARLTLLTTIGERDGARPGCETEAHLAATAEERGHVGQERRGLERFIRTLQGRRKARHATRLRSLANACSLRHLLRPLAPPALGGELGCARADLAKVLLVGSHRGDGCPFGPLQCGAHGVEIVIAQFAKRVRLDPIGKQGQLHAMALYSRALSTSPCMRSGRARVHLLYDARSRHRIEGGTARGSGSP